MGFPNVEKWLVTLHLPHESVNLGYIELTEDEKYECVTKAPNNYAIYDTLIDAAYRIVWIMADNNVHIYFSHAVVRWCMEHDEIEEVHHKGITNV